MTAAMSRTKVLIIEHDPAIRVRLEHGLSDQHVALFAPTRRQAVALAREMQPDVVTLDLALPLDDDGDHDGLRALKDILHAAPAARVVVIASTDPSQTQRALQCGAAAFVSTPVDAAEYAMVLKRVTGRDAGAGAAQPKVPEATTVDRIIGSTAPMREIFDIVTSVAKTDATVLLQGESGTGKELLARAIHGESRRHAAPFVPINCGAIPEGLLEAELFGHEKGAFTGAHVQRKGKLELADTGTVFLDEIAEIGLALQVKLLRFLQEREIERIGGRQRIRINTRVIAASNKDLKLEAAAGRLRDDLFFRLSVVTIVLPPLRERGEDIAVLASEFLRRQCAKYRRSLQFSSHAVDAILRHHWPGNIRELENAIERAVILTRGRVVEPGDLGIPVAQPAERLSLRQARNRVERQIVVETLTRTRGNISRAALELGISRPTMHDLLRKHQLAAKGMAHQWNQTAQVTT
jgi:two-component system NtrC family response regulator